MGIIWARLERYYSRFVKPMLQLIIGMAFRKALSMRGDGIPHMHYFTPDEYGVDGCEKFEFPSSAGHTLRGAKYFVPGVVPKAVVIFFHGIGAGHTAYSHEIAEIAKQGYMVFAYDNSGCMLSGGKSIENIATVARDQRDFFAYLDKREDAKGYPRYAVGHSWGGYAALMSLHDPYRIEKCVSLAGFYSAIEMVSQKAPALCKLKGPITSYLRRHYGKDAADNAIDLIKARPDKKVFLVQGDLDKPDGAKLTLDVMQEALQRCQNVSFMKLKGRRHNCYLSKRAEDYLYKLSKEIGYFTTNRDLDLKIDYDLLMEQDQKVMKAVFDFLAN